MNSRIDIMPSSAWTEAFGVHPAFEEYTECLIAPLVGVVPFVERSRLRQEALFHLERLMEDFRAEGFGIDESAKRAVHTYGSPSQVSTQFLESWYSRQAKGGLSRRFGTGNVVAFAIFAIATLIAGTLILSRIYQPSGYARDLALSPSLFNELFPSFVPFPEANLLFAVTLASIALLPLVCGALVGRIVPVKPAHCVYNGLLPCAVYSFALGVIHLPNTHLLLFALFQVLYWMPTGAFAAWATHAAMRGMRQAQGGAR